MTFESLMSLKSLPPVTIARVARTVPRRANAGMSAIPRESVACDDDARPRVRHAGRPYVALPAQTPTPNGQLPNAPSRAGLCDDAQIRIDRTNSRSMFGSWRLGVGSVTTLSSQTFMARNRPSIVVSRSSIASRRHASPAGEVGFWTPPPVVCRNSSRFSCSRAMRSRTRARTTSS